MASAEFRPLLISFLLVGLLAFSIITGGIILASNNNSPNSIGNDPYLSEYSDSIESQLQSSLTDTNSSENAISTSPITLTTGFPVFDSITGIWKTLKTVPVAIYNLTIGLLITKIFGSTSFAIVFATIGAILTITIIFAVWRWVSTGEGG